MLAALLTARARFDREPRVDLLVTVSSEALTGVLEDDAWRPGSLGGPTPSARPAGRTRARC
jgi:hypothetical protein